MKELLRLHPAQALIVLQGDDATERELLKLTLMDLLLKHVLQVEKEIHQSHPRNPPRELVYITSGSLSSQYQPLYHESLILKPFQSSPSIRVFFKTFIKVIYENIESKKNLYNVLRLSPQLKDHFKQGIFQELLGRLVLKESGLKLKETLKNEIEELDRVLPALYQSDKGRAYKIIDAIKGNIFLLKNIDFAWIKEYNEELFQGMKREQGEGGSCGTSCSSCLTDCYDSFDSSCSGDSGCSSGDSGCSGCGGCGGGGD